MARDHHIHGNIRLAFYVNDLAVDLRLPPARGRLVLAGGIEVFNEQVLHVRIEVGKAPGNALIVSDADERHAGKRKAFHIEVAGVKLELIPYAGNAVRQVHVIREQRLSGNRMRAGDNPVVRSRQAGFAGVRRLYTGKRAMRDGFTALTFLARRPKPR